jgi:hypothetical protein
MMKTQSKLFTPTHYGLSTVAALIYAMVWLVGARTQAGVPAPTQIVAVMDAVVVTAHRVPVLEPVVVTANRGALPAQLQPVVVVAKLEASRAYTRSSRGKRFQATAGRRTGSAPSVSRWLRGVLLL